MLKRCTVRTWCIWLAIAPLSALSPWNCGWLFSSISSNVLDKVFKHEKWYRTQVQQHCRRNSIWPWSSRRANLLFHPSSSKLLAVSSLAWPVWHSGVSGSLFLFYLVSCSHASYKIGTSPPCNWAEHSCWKSAACGRRATHLCPSPLCHWCVSRPNHHQLTRNIPLASPSFEASPECLLVRVSYYNSAYDNDRWLTIFFDIAAFCSPEDQKEPNSTAAVKSDCQLRSLNSVNSPSSSLPLWHKHFHMSQSAKYNLGAGWAGHRIKRTGWEHSMGLTLVLVAIHLCRITSSFPKRQEVQEILRQVPG